MNGLSRDAIAKRAAMDLWDGAVVNLGIGLPTLVANYVPAGREIVYHSENGILGVGPSPGPNAIDPDLINASKTPVSLLPGASIFHHTDAFVMIRGGKSVDVSIKRFISRTAFVHKTSCFWVKCFGGEPCEKFTL